MFERIQKELAEYFEIDPAKITPDTKFVDDLGADSLALMELMFNLENETGKTIEDDVMDTVKSVGDLVKYIESK
ncbi:MAG: acyl carrier protein [Clostridiales bacterium]|nr:acyl carrier protein [Clostridiales bacterium]